MNPLDDFMKNARGLAKNPLGIIALFVSLIYGFACLVLSTSIKNLESNERIPLIWFIILFPVVILVSFLYLVVNHHKKLYAPSDFRDEGNFIKILDEKSQKVRLDNEIKLLSSEQNLAGNVRRRVKGRKNTKYQEESLGQLDEITRLRESYLMVEELSLRALEKDLFKNVQRQSAVYTTDNSRIEYDGIGIDGNGNYYGIEVKYTKNETLSSQMVDSIKSKLDEYENLKLKQKIGVNFYMYIVVVTDKKDTSKIENQLYLNSKNYKSRIDYKVFNLEELKSRFGFKEK